MTVIYNSNCYGRGLLRRLCNFAFTAPFIPVYYYGIHCNAFKLCEYFSILLLTVLPSFFCDLERSEVTVEEDSSTIPSSVACFKEHRSIIVKLPQMYKATITALGIFCGIVTCRDNYNCSQLITWCSQCNMKAKSKRFVVKRYKRLKLERNIHLHLVVNPLR